MTSHTEPADSTPHSEVGITSDIEPDEKDWTWVLQRPCPECGFDAGSVVGKQVAPSLRAYAVRWTAVLARAGVGTRPDLRVWSPLEYGCHVRDVCRVFESRTSLMRLQGDPTFENWDQDATAIAEAYGSQDPAVVSVELSAAAEAAAAGFDVVGDGEWQRTGRRGDVKVFTIESLGRYFLHDVAHHLHDVRG